MKPLSAFYYIKENKAKAAVCIIMIALTAGLFLMGNFVQSGPQSFFQDYTYSDKLVTVSGTSNGVQDYLDFLEQVKKDKNLHYLERTAWGLSGMQHTTAMGLKMGGGSYVFNSVEDLKTAFKRLNIQCDYTNVKNGSLIISKDFANNRGIKLGDIIDHSFDSALDRAYSVDAFIDDNSYLCFYVLENSDNLYRMYLYSDTMEGPQLYDYVNDLAKGKNVLISDSYENTVKPQFEMLYVIFYTIVILISVIMAVTVNSVLAGHYIKRKYEFGIYRALGKTKKDVFLKCASEMFCMDILGAIIGLGISILATYLLNGICFNPNGIYLPYISMVAIIGFALCNILIVIPVILINGRMCIKADVTEF
jgi:ABC-type antimicrobial peptide transport system permease subunit